MDRNNLIKRIWAIAKNRGMDSDNLHDFIAGYTNKDSIKKLSDAQLHFIVNRLNGESYEKKESYKFNQDEYLFHLIEVVRDKFGVKDMDAYLNSICQKQFKCNYSGIDSYKKSRLIDILKSHSIRLSNNDIAS